MEIKLNLHEDAHVNVREQVISPQYADEARTMTDLS
jgi:hypothetical protein